MNVWLAQAFFFFFNPIRRRIKNKKKRHRAYQGLEDFFTRSLFTTGGWLGHPDLGGGSRTLFSLVHHKLPKMMSIWLNQAIHSCILRGI